MEYRTDLAIRNHGGDLFELTGDGGCAAFESAGSAIGAAIEMQRALVEGDLAVRVGVYSGEAERRHGDWFGIPLNRCARVMALGHGGQILVGASTAQLVPRSGFDGTWSLRDLGVHVLRDIDEPVVVHQAVADGLPDGFPPLVSASRVVSLPAPRDRLIGRDGDIDDGVEAFASHRLVTVCGVGGAGKTRLAIEVARRLSEQYSATVFVDLSLAVRDSQVLTATTNAHGLSDTGIEQLDLLTSHLATRSSLLLFDNAEHRLDATCELAEAMLDRCPSSVILVTSREPLGLSGERVFRVRSLDPDTAGVELLRERVGQPIDESQAVQLCEHLDGIPLAIELAAARIRSLGIDEVLANIGDRFRLLVGGRRAQGRQSTLHATLVWSYELLNDDERTLLRRLAVFAGGFPARAVAVVCDDPTSVIPPREVLAGLVDKSMVAFEAGRHRLLETVRLFAQEQLLAAGETDAYRDKHAAWLRDELREQQWVSSTLQMPLVPEISNIRAAADWLDDAGRHDELLELVVRSEGVRYQIPGGDREFHPKVASAFERCGRDVDDEMSVLACAVLAATAPTAAEAFQWVGRGHGLDPYDELPNARTIGLMHRMANASVDPHGALRELVELAALPGGLDPEVALTCRQFQAQISFELGDVDRAETILESGFDDRTCMYWYGPITTLVVLRAVTGDVAGAHDALERIGPHERSGMRITPLALSSINVHLAVARSDVAAAGSALRGLEALRDDVRLTLNDAADHHWCNAAADLAGLVGDIDAAAVLVSGATATRRVETHPFVISTLTRRYEHDPAWQAAMARTPSLDDAIAAARRLARST